MITTDTLQNKSRDNLVRVRTVVQLPLRMISPAEGSSWSYLNGTSSDDARKERKKKNRERNSEGPASSNLKLKELRHSWRILKKLAIFCSSFDKFAIRNPC